MDTNELGRYAREKQYADKVELFLVNTSINKK